MFRNLFGVRLPRLALHTLLLALPFAAILAEPALAQNLDPLENMLQVVVDGLTGPIGRLIAILAVVAAGYMMFTGRLNWPLFLAIFFGVVLVFSAATIIDGFAAPKAGSATGRVASPIRLGRSLGCSPCMTRPCFSASPGRRRSSAFPSATS